MNVVVMMSDSLRTDHLSPYGETWCQTPNAAAFAETGAVFENAYVGSFPTIPVRTDLFTGRFGEPFHPWLPLSYGETTLPQLFREAGYLTGLICDTPHLIQGGHNFDFPFNTWEFIRGQEMDRWIMHSRPLDPRLKGGATASREELAEAYIAQCFRNIRARRREQDWPVAMTYQTAIDWLQDNRTQEKFFLWVDSFDPHSPNLPPQQLTDLYDPGYEGTVWLGGVPDLNQAPEAELSNIRARYAGTVTFVDRCVGRLLAALDDLGLAENTCVVWISDHGMDLGDRGMLYEKDPVYNEIARLVFMVRMPGCDLGGRRFGHLVQPADLAPTLLEAADLPVPERMQGRSFLPLLQNKPYQSRQVAFSSGEAQALPPIILRDHRWILADSMKPEKRRLFDVEADPGQTINVVAEHPDQVERLHNALLEFLKSHDAQLQEVRLWETGSMGDETGYVPIRRGFEHFSPYWDNVYRGPLTVKMV